MLAWALLEASIVDRTTDAHRRRQLEKARGIVLEFVAELPFGVSEKSGDIAAQMISVPLAGAYRASAATPQRCRQKLEWAVAFLRTD
jgi:hypothetical protein